MKRRSLSGILVLLLGVFLTACAVNDVPDSVGYNSNQKWAILPILNYSQEPRAGERAEAMLGTLLQTRGFHQLVHYPNLDQENSMPELNERNRLDRALAWAKSSGIRYGFSGTVAEWRYKSGLDAEPAVGMTLQILDVATGQVIWSTSASRSGWGRESLSGNAQKVIRTLVDAIQVAGE